MACLFPQHHLSVMLRKRQTIHGGPQGIPAFISCGYTPLPHTTVNMAQGQKGLLADLSCHFALMAQQDEMHDTQEGNKNSGMTTREDQVLKKIDHLLWKQANPIGEMYAVQKMLSQHSTNLRAVFLYYAQLTTGPGQHWPPVLTLPQWTLFCENCQVPDLTSGSCTTKIPSPECTTIFQQYSEAGTGSTKAVQGSLTVSEDTGQVLPYEQFLAAVVQLASQQKPPGVLLLSEQLRTFVIKRMYPAWRGTGMCMKKGCVRSPVETGRLAVQDNGGGKACLADAASRCSSDKGSLVASQLDLVPADACITIQLCAACDNLGTQHSRREKLNLALPLPNCNQ